MTNKQEIERKVRELDNIITELSALTGKDYSCLTNEELNQIRHSQDLIFANVIKDYLDNAYQDFRRINGCTQEQMEIADTLMSNLDRIIEKTTNKKPTGEVDIDFNSADYRAGIENGKLSYQTVVEPQIKAESRAEEREKIREILKKLQKEYRIGDWIDNHGINVINEALKAIG